MRRSTAAILVALFCACFGIRAAAGTPVAVNALPHKATYDLTLGEMQSSGLIADAVGRMEFEWTDVCDGWAINQKFRLTIYYDDGTPLSFGWSLSSWESKDGKRYRFFIRRFDGSGESEALRGVAELGADGSGRAIYSEPEAREVALPAGTLFPTGHSIHILERAGVGGPPIWSVVFDGSSEDGAMGVSAVISAELPAGSPAQLASPLLRGQASWQMNLAYYQPGVAEAEPEQEQLLRLFGNGVFDEMRLDYGDFVLNADLTGLKELPQPDC